MAIDAVKNTSSIITSFNHAESVPEKAGTGSETEAAKTSEKMGQTSVASSQQDQHPYDPNDPLQVQNTQNVSADKIKRAVQEINQKIRPTRTSCQYSYHEETNRISIKVIDDDTQKVIREIPPEKTLDMIAKALELEGILVDEKR